MDLVVSTNIICLPVSIAIVIRRQNTVRIRTPLVMSDTDCSITIMRVATRGHWGARPPLLRLVPPQMKILQMGLHASDLAPLCSV